MKKAALLGFISVIALTALFLSACGRHETVDNTGTVVTATEAPKETPTQEPTTAPTQEPTAAPTQEPTSVPTKAPTPTEVPEAQKDVYLVSMGDETAEFRITEFAKDLELPNTVHYIGAANGKVYLFYNRLWLKSVPFEGPNLHVLGIIDLETEEYKEVEIRSELTEMCKNMNDDTEGYAEEGNNYFDVVPDEISTYYYLDYYSDQDELAEVSFERFGFDTEGNVFALARFFHEYWANRQLNYDEGDYELLKWDPEGNLIMSGHIFSEDELDAELPEGSIAVDDYAEITGIKDPDGFELDIMYTEYEWYSFWWTAPVRVDDERIILWYLDNDQERHLGMLTRTN